ncbi:MAG: PspC domain-containing protein [Lysobacteraceae bacterium]
MTATPRLVRIGEGRVLAGVVGGIAARFGWNPTLTRIGFVLLSVFSAAFPGIVVYLVLWLLIPEAPEA